MCGKGEWKCAWPLLSPIILVLPIHFLSFSTGNPLGVYKGHNSNAFCVLKCQVWTKSWNSISNAWNLLHFLNTSRAKFPFFSAFPSFFGKRKTWKQQLYGITFTHCVGSFSPPMTTYGAIETTPSVCVCSSVSVWADINRWYMFTLARLQIPRLCDA